MFCHLNGPQQQFGTISSQRIVIAGRLDDSPASFQPFAGLWRCRDCSEVEARERTCAIFWTLSVQTGAGCVCVCACVFTLHANSDVPIAAQTSCCCWRSSQKLFSSVVKFNFNVLLCHRMCSLPSCRGRPSCAALAGCRHPRVKAELQISHVPSDRFYEESASLGPSIPLALLPLSLDNALALRTEMLSLDLSLSLKAHMVKFLKTLKYPTKGLGKPPVNTLLLPPGSVRREAGSALVPGVDPACGRYRDLNPGESRHCGQASFNAPCLTEPASRKLVQGNSGVLRGPAEHGGASVICWQPAAETDWWNTPSQLALPPHEVFSFLCPDAKLENVSFVSRWKFIVRQLSWKPLVMPSPSLHRWES